MSVSIKKKKITNLEFENPVFLKKAKIEPDSSILHVFSTLTQPLRYSSPMRFITCDTNSCSNFFTSMYNVYFMKLHPFGSPRSGEITREQFVLGCRVVMKSRIDFIYKNVSGKPAEGHIKLSKGLKIPKALADMINGIGPIKENNQSCYKFCPKPEPHPEDSTQSLDYLATDAVMTAFSEFILRLESSKIIQTSLLKTTLNGSSAWWLLSARKILNSKEIATGGENAIPFAVFQEWNSEDGLMAVLVQNGYDGVVEGHKALTVCGAAVTNVNFLRRAYFLNM